MTISRKIFLRILEGREIFPDLFYFSIFFWEGDKLYFRISKTPKNPMSHKKSMTPLGMFLNLLQNISLWSRGQIEPLVVLCQYRLITYSNPYMLSVKICTVVKSYK